MGIGLLGPLQVDGRPAPLGPRDRVVLAALALHPGEVLPADRLAEALWGEQVPPSWRKVVQGAVVRLRRLLGRDAVETTADGYRLQVPADEVDACRFEALVRTAAGHASAGEHERAVAAYERALGLWRGDVAADLDRWADGSTEATRLVELRHGAEDALLEARLASGAAAAVVADAQALVAREPLRERRWAALVLALYRTGRQGEALNALARARRLLREELGLDPGERLVALEAAVLRHDPGLRAADDPPREAAARCPWPGLVSYGPGDADWFFGRDAEVAACLDRLASGVLVVVGASGSGKSSLLRAGVAPVLRGSGRPVTVLTPGLAPLAALAAATAVAGPGVTGAAGALVVDQLEELFTAPAAAGDAAAFLDRLAEHAAAGGPVLAALRADHVGDLAVCPRFARLAEAGMHLLGPMTAADLVTAVEGPARLAGLVLQPGLVDLLVHEVHGEPGALPLLSHALAETWERREGRVLTVDAYRATGGVRGAVAQSAERLYESLPASDRERLRRVVLRMVATDADGQAVSAPAALPQLGADPDRRRILDLLVRARLVTADADSARLAHESLARAWPRLRTWLDADAEGQRTLRHLDVAAAEWDRLGRPDSELYRGDRLRRVLAWRVDAAAEDLAPVEAAFLAASERQAVVERQRAAAYAGERARAHRRLRTALSVTAVGLVLTLVAAVTAAVQWRGATAAERTAVVEQVIAQSTAARATRRDLAALLAAEAYAARPDAVTRGLLLGTAAADPAFVRYVPTPDRVPVVAGRLLPDGTLLAAGADAVVRRLHLDDAVEVDGAESFSPPPAADDTVVDVSRDGRVLVQAAWTDDPATDDLRWLVAHDTATGRPRFPARRVHFAVGDVAVSPDGRHIAVAGDALSAVAVYDGGTGRWRGSLPSLPAPADAPADPRSAAVAFGSDGRLYAGSRHGVLRVADATTVTEVARLRGPAGTAEWDLAVTGDGATVLTSGPAGVTRWDLTEGRAGWTSAAGGTCSRLAVASQLGAGSVVCAGPSSRLGVLDLRTGLPRPESFALQHADVTDVLVSADGRTLVATTGSTPVVGVWRLDGGGALRRPLVAAARPVSFSRDGTMLLAREAGTGDQLVVDAATGAPLHDVPGLTGLAWTPDGHLLAHTAEGAVVRYDVRGSRVVAGLAPPRRDIRLGNVVVGAPTGAAVDPTGARALVWYTDGQVRAYDLRSGRRLRPDPLPQAAVAGAAWSADGGLVVVGRRDGGGLVTLDGLTFRPLARRDADVTEVAVSSTGLVAVTEPQGVTLLDLRTLEVRQRVTTGSHRGGGLAFSADGRLLAAGGADGQARVVDVATGLPLGGDLEAVGRDDADVALRPDGAALAVSHASGTVVWDLRPDRWAAAVCDLAGRDLTPAERRTYLGPLADSAPAC